MVLPPLLLAYLLHVVAQLPVFGLQMLCTLLAVAADTDYDKENGCEGQDDGKRHCRDNPEVTVLLCAFGLGLCHLEPGIGTCQFPLHVLGIEAVADVGIAFEVAHSGLGVAVFQGFIEAVAGVPFVVEVVMVGKETQRTCQVEHRLTAFALTVEHHSHLREGDGQGMGVAGMFKERNGMLQRVAGSVQLVLFHQDVAHLRQSRPQTHGVAGFEVDEIGTSGSPQRIVIPLHGPVDFGLHAILYGHPHRIAACRAVRDGAFDVGQCLFGLLRGQEYGCHVGKRTAHATAVVEAFADAVRSLGMTEGLVVCALTEMADGNEGFKFGNVSHICRFTAMLQRGLGIMQGLRIVGKVEKIERHLHPNLLAEGVGGHVGRIGYQPVRALFLVQTGKNPMAQPVEFLALCIVHAGSKPNHIVVGTTDREDREEEEDEKEGLHKRVSFEGGHQEGGLR